MTKTLDLTGQRFGKLTAIKRVGNRGRFSCWLCKCDCGKEKIIKTNSLKTGNTLSCGCLKTDIKIKHNMAGTNLYQVWNNLKQRCFNPNNPRYKYYGKRGIKVCDEWKLSFESFQKWALDNDYEEGLTIDRIDVNGNYEPSNCRWVNQAKQMRNTRKTVFLTYNGETHCLVEWAEITGIRYSRIKWRYEHGYPIEKIFFKGNLLQARGVKYDSI